MAYNNKEVSTKALIKSHEYLTKEESLELIKLSFENHSSELTFYVNSSFKRLKTIDSRITILEYLRENGYCGTKLGCNEGGCGACTVVLAEYDQEKKMVKYRSCNSCILPLCSANNKQIITVEGIGSPKMPHPIQERIAKGHGSQCGFCTPGIVMSFYSLLKLNPTPSMHDIEESFDGNLCRCTGYRPILESAKSFSIEANHNSCSNGCSTVDSKFKSKLVDFTEFKPYDPNLDIPFPQSLLKLETKHSLILYNAGIVWIEPSTLDELTKAKSFFPDAKLVGGNSEVGIEMKFKAANYKTFINISNIQELNQMSLKRTCDKHMIEIGCSITISDLIVGLKDMSQKCEPFQKSLFEAFLVNLRYFASRQIRNFATLGGNIVTGSPISDLNPILVANNAVLTVLSEGHGSRTRTIPIRNFYLGYRKIDLKPDEVLVKLSIDLPSSKFQIVKAYKQSKRKEDDIAIVNACFRVKLEQSGDFFKISNLDLSYGGLAPTTIYLKGLNEIFRGKLWADDGILKSIQDEILKCVDLTYSVPGGMPTYRRTLAVSFFTKFWYQVIKELDIGIQNPQILNSLDDIKREVSSSILDFGDLNQNEEIHLGTTNPHLSSLIQTTGVAKYLDDIPKQAGELYVGCVCSTKAHAYIKSIDASKALELEGVQGFVCHQDVPSDNNIFGIGKDEEIFASKEVHFNGQLIGFVIAETRNLAKQAASLVKVEYEELVAIFTIREAIEKNSFYHLERRLQKGEFDSQTFCVDGTSDEIIEGEMEVGGQEHFYLETHGCLVIPKVENDEYEIYASSQNISEIQTECAHVLNIPANRVVAKVKRLGGGFGGKETRSTHLALATMVAAKKLGRTIRCVLDRDIDMLMTGTRHPFYGKYRLRIGRDGFFKASDIELINNAGYSLDLSYAVMDGAIYKGMDNVYNFPKTRVLGRLAKTNIASNTAFRGFGAPQGMMILETMISQAAEHLRMDVSEIREKNMYKENDVTPFDMYVEDWFVPEMFKEIQVYTNFKEQKAEIEKFNSENRWKKRGISVMATRFPISFTPKFMNQASALVHIYTDGSVAVNHNGIEMGQGLHTKMVAIAANTLKISPDLIHISDTSTDKCINGSASAASMSTDLNGMAVQDACQKLYERILPYRQKKPKGTMRSWACAAYLDRVSLSANGFYMTPGLTFDFELNKGRLFAYSTNGVAVSSVELDVLTGDHTILRSDIYMDIGNSINYAIDVGQIEGAFVQGVGWCTIEELMLHSASGSSLTRGPGAYKIPGFGDIPQQFNVKILRGKEYKHLKTVKSSKGVGEPPLFLGATVFFALRDAVLAARRQNGISEPLTGFYSPCTPEILRLACADELVRRAKVSPKIFNEKRHEKEKLWSIRP